MASVQTVERIAAELLAGVDRMVEDATFGVQSAAAGGYGGIGGWDAGAMVFPVLSLMLGALRGSERPAAEPAELRRLARSAAVAGASLAWQLDAVRVVRTVLLGEFEERVRGKAGEQRLLLEAEGRLARLQPWLAAGLAAGHLDAAGEGWAREKARLASLLALASAINRHLEIEDVARSGLVETLRGLRLDTAGLWLMEDDEGLVLTSAVGLNWEENRLLRAVSTRSSWLISMAACEPAPIQARFHSGNAVLSGFRSAVACRLERDGSLMGVLLLASRAERTFGDAELGFVASATELIANAIDRGQRHRREARTDFLTGLANRQEFERAMERELATAERHGRPLSLMLIDLDGLKAINDEHGHHTGDVAIRTLAELLRKEVRATDTCARLGGDEFALAMPGAELHQAEEVAARLRTALQTVSRGGLPGPIEVSFGLAGWLPGMDFERLFKIADDRLYQDKRRKQARQRSLRASTG